MNPNPIIRSITAAQQARTLQQSTARCLRRYKVCSSMTPTRYASTKRQNSTLPSYESPAELREGLLGEQAQYDEPQKTRNPLDTISRHRDDASSRAFYRRKMLLSGAGTMLAFLMTMGLIYTYDVPTHQADSPEDVKATFAGKPVEVAAGGAKLVAKDPNSGAEEEVVETGTSTIPHFPKTIRVPNVYKASGNEEDSEFTLVGLGIRTVSFLSIQVYVVGFYVRTADVATLQSALIKTINPSASTLISTEKDQLKQALLDPEKGMQIWDHVLKDTGISTAFRIVPTRGTDFAHLRDGWVRGITARSKDAQARGDEQFSDDSFGVSVQDFKAIFGGRDKAPKGSVVLLTRDGRGVLEAYSRQKEGKGSWVEMGRVGDERISRLVWLGYLAGKSVSSEGARKSIVDGCEELVGRPVGTVETMVT